MSAPLVVNTTDGTVWTRRGTTRGGEALYAPEGVCKCPEFVMATLAELAEHGIAGSADVLPVPVGPEPQTSPVDDDRAKAPWGRDEDGRPLLPMGAHWTDIPELVDRTLAGIEDRVDQAQPGHWFTSPTAEASGTVCTRYDGYTRTVGRFTNVLPADLELVLHAHSDLRWCLDVIVKLRSRVAELETERHSTNEALDDAVKALRADRDRIAELEASQVPGETYPPALPWAALMDHEDLTEFLDELAASAITHASSEVALAEVEAMCGRWRLIAEAQHAHNTAPGPDAMTRTFAPTQALREPGPHAFVKEYQGESDAKRRLPNCRVCGRPASDSAHDEDVTPQVQKLRALLAGQRAALEDPHDSPLHHSYRLGRDLPPVGGAS